MEQILQKLKPQPSFRSASSAFLLLLPQLFLVPVEHAVCLGVHYGVVVTVHLGPISLGPGRLSGSQAYVVALVLGWV